jgi:glucokinase
MQEKIQKKMPKNIPVIIDNLPRFQVFAEKSLGIARNLCNVISIFAGYGLAAGVIIEGEIKRGQHKIMGEVGHMVINPAEEMQCACGAHGCFEVMVSIDRIKKLLDLNSSRYSNSMLFSNNGKIEKVSAEEIFDAYKKGDGLVSYVMDDIINWFAIGLSNIILIFDPQVVVIHGIYTRAGDKFLDKLKEKVGQISLTNIKKETKIEFSELGNDAGVLGAATYVINEFFA